MLDVLECFMVTILIQKEEKKSEERTNFFKTMSDFLP